MKEEFQFAIDRGGTFTDIWARCPGGKIEVMKLLSVDPQNYKDAPREGIRRILEQVKFFINVTGGEKSNLNWDSNTGPLAFRASALTTKLLRPNLID